MRWDEFTAACPELAGLARDRFERDQVVMLGTIRRDGRPRLSPCELDFAAGHLLLGMMWKSPKAADLLRDPRLTVHSVPSDRMNPGGDVKLYGTANDERDAGVRAAFLRAIRERIDWEPTEPYHLFSVDVTESAFMRFGDEVKETWRWAPATGLRKERVPDA
jgi:Pyridoxamine 5'-phosphate oxidase